MRRLLALLLTVAAAGYVNDHSFGSADQAPRQIGTGAASAGNPRGDTGRADPEPSAVERAFAEHRSNVQLTVSGIVSKVLRDDTQGARHQRFIMRLPSGHTLMVSHNIDLAERVADLQIDTEIAVSGEYEWNEQGGVMHWTHHDPGGRHPPGWIKYRERIYQ